VINKILIYLEDVVSININGVYVVISKIHTYLKEVLLSNIEIFCNTIYDFDTRNLILYY